MVYDIWVQEVEGEEEPTTGQVRINLGEVEALSRMTEIEDRIDIGSEAGA